MSSSSPTKTGDHDSEVNDEYDSLEAGKGGDGHDHPRPSAMEKSTLQVGTVALLVFFTVSGGPLGSEDAVSLRFSSRAAFLRGTN